MESELVNPNLDYPNLIWWFILVLVQESTLTVFFYFLYDQAYLEEDVGRIEVSVADAFAMHVLHATYYAMQHRHHGLPPAFHAWFQEPSRINCHAQASSIAVLL
jgi:hypothetical protein